MDKEIVLEKEKQENKQEEIPVLQNENQEESLVDTDSKLHKMVLDYKYQPFVDEIYQHLDVKHQELLEDEYKAITLRNEKYAQTLPGIGIRLYFNYKKSLYFVNSVISYLFHQIGWSLAWAGALWFVLGNMFRGFLFDFYYQIIRISDPLFHNLAVFFYRNKVNFAVAPDDFSVSLEKCVANLDNDPYAIWQKAHEIIIFVTFMTIVFFIIKNIAFVIKNRKTKDQDVKHQFDYDIKRSLFMLQASEDDSFAYIKQNFKKRLRRYCGSDFQRRKYMTSYVNVYQSHVLETKEGLSLTSKEYHKVILSTIWEGLIHIISWISFNFGCTLILLGVCVTYLQSTITNPELGQAFMQIPFPMGLKELFYSFSTILNQTPLSLENEYERFVWGGYLFFVFCLLVLSVYKRVIRPTMRHYQRGINFYLKKEAGTYQKEVIFKSVSVFKFWAFLGICIFLPFVVFVLYSI